MLCSMLCCAVLCCAVLCCAMLCYAIPCYTMLYYTNTQSLTHSLTHILDKCYNLVDANHFYRSKKQVHTKLWQLMFI